MIYGSYVLTEPWPARTDDYRSFYLDQFSGRTLAVQAPKDWGGLQQWTEYGIETHMGTQFGLINRIVMTFGALAVLWMAFSALVMWWKRRPKGQVGLPRRPTDTKLRPGLIAILAILAIIYPLWGATAIAVLLIDRFIVRNIPPLRRAFGMR